ncbi:putative quinol monooxygenase [Nocardia sp. NBC_01388]|uniref:putative quinol monooxygenase n=1 Tax=Nocardia sp. NBC_01388 TaxID=2903596 RepID=UPI003253F177
MTLHVVAEIRVKAGQEDRLRTALEAMIEPTLTEPGCVVYQPFVDPNDAAHMVLIEEWKSAGALEEHFLAPHFVHLAGVFDEILAEPVTINRLIAE